MKLLLPEVNEITLVIDSRLATVYIKQEGWPSATVVFDSTTEARKYIRSLQVAGEAQDKQAPFTEIDIVKQTERVGAPRFRYLRGLP